MLDLHEIPLFSQLSSADQRVVRSIAREIHFSPGAALCRKGDVGQYLFAIASGGVKVMFGTDRGVFLGPGHIIGELSVLSGMPVSASVYAAKPTKAFAFDRDAFWRLLDSSPQLHRTLAEILVDRLQQDPMGRASEGPLCTVLLVPDSSPDCYPLTRALCRRIATYCPDAVYCEMRAPEELAGMRERAASEWSPPPFECPPHAWAPLPAADRETGRDFLIDRDAVPPDQVLERWRSIGVTGQHLILTLPSAQAGRLKSAFCHGDALIPFRVNASGHPPGPVIGEGTHGEADVLEVRLCFPGRAAMPSGGSRWSLVLDLPDMEAMEADEVDRTVGKEFDLLARWSVGRSIGIAMGAGAARGFAHLGVLKVLEEARIPLDCFSGTSIGGIVALTYVHAGSADDAIRLVRECLGGRRKVLDRFKTLQASIYPGIKINRAAATAFHDVRIEDLPRPVSAVAADLITGEKVVMDRGSAAVAALATSAIPGFFPPVTQGGRVLIDGAPVSRVPVDLLDRHRCRLKMAVNVSPRPDRDEAAVQQILGRVYSFFGFSNVWLRSWEVQAYWDGVKETSQADILLEPDTRDFSMFEFDRFDELVELGIRTATERLDAIHAAVKIALSPESL